MLTVAASLLVAGTVTSAMADPGPIGTPGSAPASTKTIFPHPDDPDAPLRAALQEAKQRNETIPVESAFTETSRTWAYPDGHLATDSYSGPA
ncbi:hypothetical protein ACIBO2_57145 [Nonomuraea sp. NPDC050022]